MFLQVSVPKKECRLLRCLWRETPDDPVTTFEYKRHVFGARSSPICVNYALHRSSEDNKETFPIVSSLIKRNFYMDDFIKSVKTDDEAKEVFANVTECLKLSGFELKK